MRDFSSHLKIVDFGSATTYELGDFMLLKTGVAAQLLDIYPAQQLISVRYTDGTSAAIDMQQIKSKLEVSKFKQQLKELL